ncbi:hypothetical protein N7451_009317 [Penicillium sp. IBT 35674x]|nr:hypothetical protein N7451_009317 [Penicillium sp. IBT 35674x]
MEAGTLIALPKVASLNSPSAEGQDIVVVEYLSDQHRLQKRSNCFGSTNPAASCLLQRDCLWDSSPVELTPN